MRHRPLRAKAHRRIPLGNSLLSLALSHLSARRAAFVSANQEGTPASERHVTLAGRLIDIIAFGRPAGINRPFTLRNLVCSTIRIEAQIGTATHVV